MGQDQSQRQNVNPDELDRKLSYQRELFEHKLQLERELFQRKTKEQEEKFKAECAKLCKEKKQDTPQTVHPDGNRHVNEILALEKNSCPETSTVLNCTVLNPNNLYPNLHHNQIATPSTSRAASAQPSTSRAASAQSTTSRAASAQPSTSRAASAHSTTSRAASAQSSTSLPASAKPEGESRPSAPPAWKLDSKNPRSKSATRNRSNLTYKNTAYNCSTCKKLLGIVIFQCENDHSCCIYCKNEERRCGKCHSSITDTRNYALESIIAELKVPCENVDDGCIFRYKIADMNPHLKECLYKTINCPLTLTGRSCEWHGKISQLTSHFESSHPNYGQAKVNEEMSLTNIDNDEVIVHYVEVGKFKFLFAIKIDTSHQLIYMTVQHFSTKKCASKWSYELQVYNKSEPCRKIFYKDSCYTFSTKLEDIINESKCAAFYLPYVATFINKKKVINYKIFIKKLFNENLITD